jgi:hypothetical protein
LGDAVLDEARLEGLMDDRELWAVTFQATMKNQSDDFGNLITERLTVHVVTEKGYKHAIEAAFKDVEATWSAHLVKLENLGGAPLVLER